MKTKSLILAGLALAALVSCNKTPEETPVIDGGQAYLAVKIAYANPATRGTDDGYAVADDNENALVSSADFFFYMADGTYFTHSSQTITTTESTGNVEEIGEGIVVLKGLSSTDTPKYMAVVLNGNTNTAPTGSTTTALIDNLKGKSIDEAKAYITENYAEYTTDANGTKTWSNFTMTSSSYVNATENAGYYCAELTSDMFFKTQAAAEEEAKKTSNAKVAVAYVERVAAKATLTTSMTAQSGTTDIYALDSTAPAIEVFDASTTSYTTPVYYVKLNGWGLNSTTTSSYTYKHINPDWNLGSFTWDASSDFRSFWAESVNYGLTSAYYPKTYNNETPVYQASQNTLDYISYEECDVKLKSSSYCRENTNTKAVLEASNFNSTVTSVLLAAQIVDAAHNPVNLVICDYRYFTESGYYSFVLNRNSANVPYVLEEGSYKKADSKYLTLVNDGDAYVHVEFLDKDATTGNAITYYKNATGTTVTVDEVNANWGRNASQAEFYKNGMMYYNIPIEHLRNSGTYADGNYDEADYGVVRNHWYKLDVTKIANLGHPVFDETEKIVPNDDDTKKYYVAAKINILSWKVVKQSVAL